MKHVKPLLYVFKKQVFMNLFNKFIRFNLVRHQPINNAYVTIMNTKIDLDVSVQTKWMMMCVISEHYLLQLNLIYKMDCRQHIHYITYEHSHYITLQQSIHTLHSIYLYKCCSDVFKVYGSVCTIYQQVTFQLMS